MSHYVIEAAYSPETRSIVRAKVTRGIAVNSKEEFPFIVQ